MQTRAIKSKIKSTQSISKITRTMEMVSVAKMRKALLVAEGYKPFDREAKRILNTLADQSERHPLQLENKSEKSLCIIVGGQKGLCGGYNTSIYREVYKYVTQHKNVDFICIGKYGEKIAKKFKESKIISSFNEKEFKSVDARVITKIIIKAYLNKKYSRVNIVYTDFENITALRTTTFQVLPFKVANNDIVTDDLEYSFEPSVTEVYDAAIKIIIQNMLSGFVSISRAAEHAARMMAMKTATDNAGEMLDELKLWYNKVRQAGITQEIAEISSGAMAVSK